MKKLVFLTAVSLAGWLAQAAPPFTVPQLQVRVKVRPCQDAGLAQNSMYNCRFFDGSIYAPQINAYCWGRYPSGSSIFSALVTSGQTRMVAPFPGALKATYVLASGGTLYPFTRYDFDGANPVDATFPDGQRSESFDWVNENTIICNDYVSGNYKRLYLIHVEANPFSLTKTNTWNSDGYVTTPVSTRIRNVRVSQSWPDYAYYGDNGQADHPKVYAINLKNGASLEIGQWDGVLRSPTSTPPSASSSWGLWTVVERGGYLYLQSSDDGIQVFPMSGPTTMGPKFRDYFAEELNQVAGNATPYYGFDVAENGERWLLGDYFGTVCEFGPPLLKAVKSGTDVVLSWPASVTAVRIESSTDLTGFAEMDPQPDVIVDGQWNTATIPAGSGTAFFRLRKSP